MSVTTTCRSISALTDAAQKACTLFLERCKKEGLSVCITETYRSQARQNYLYEQGRTKPGKVVTWTKKSRHTSGRAWDICQNVKGREYNDAQFFKKCGAIATDLGIIWGGTWSPPDTPHFEIPTNWEWEGDEEMTSEEKLYVKSLENRILQLENSKEKIYHYFDELPGWARPTIEKLYAEGVYKGESAQNLNLPESLMRTLIIVHRMKG